MLGIAFAGFRHGHINGLYKQAEASPDVKIVAAWEDNAPAREAAAASLGVDFNKETYEELLADPAVEAVAIGDYFARRGSLVIAALKAGKHVISDKPMCTSLAELDEIERLQREKGLVCTAMLDVRLAFWAQKMREIIADGTLGELHNGAFTGQHPLNYGTRPGWYFEPGKQGGTINDLAIHGIDILPIITGLKYGEPVAARCWNAYAKEVPFFEDCAQIMFTLENGCGIMADISYSSPSSCGFALPQYWRFTLWGEKGMAEFGMNIRPHITLALEGGNGPVEYAVEEGETATLMESFLALLDGKPSALDMEQTFAASRMALTLQALADKK